MISQKGKTAYVYWCLIVMSVMYYANSYSQNVNTLVDAHDTQIQYEGRTGFNNPGIAELYWPGSSIRVRFKGTGISAILRDQRGDNYYNVIIDDDSIHVLKPGTAQKTYMLADQLPGGEHTVELFRRSGLNGVTWFYGFQLPEGTKIIAPPRPGKRMIEFYGNSITVGSGINEEGDRNGSENNYLGYAAITARHFGARYSCIARSGIGLMVSWFSMIMPELYSRLNPYDSNSVWDFSKAMPGIVVINLFQNDYSIVNMPDRPEFKRRFGRIPPTEEFIVGSYRKFVQRIRSHYPAAHIICVLGNMDAGIPGSPWPGYIEKAVESLGDKNVYTHFFPYKNTPDHPNVAEQRQMAESLIRFIEEHIKW
ncbi:MAG: SGNH/GDSL hydrolase family protein [Ferruginibacter sp.]